eukprot:490432_1
MTTIDFNRLLRKYVANTTNVADLIPLLSELVPLETIQHLLYARIQPLDNDTKRRICCKALPIQSILPMDLIQHTVSFTNSTSVQCVNKAFKQAWSQTSMESKRAWNQTSMESKRPDTVHHDPR